MCLQLESPARGVYVITVYNHKCIVYPILRILWRKIYMFAVRSCHDSPDVEPCLLKKGKTKDTPTLPTISTDHTIKSLQKEHS